MTFGKKWQTIITTTNIIINFSFCLSYTKTWKELLKFPETTHFLTVILLLLLCSILYEKASLKRGLSPSLQHGRMCKRWLGVANAPGKSQQLGFVRRVEPTNRKSIFYLSFIFNSNYLSPSPIDLFRVIAVSYHIKLSFSFDAAFDFPLFS